MSPYQARVLTESQELREKVEKLKAFLNGPFVSTVDPLERCRLSVQLHVMQQYLDILTERIANFPK